MDTRPDIRPQSSLKRKDDILIERMESLGVDKTTLMISVVALMSIGASYFLFKELLEKH